MRIKKLLTVLFLALISVVVCIPTNAFAYEGGLLNGKVLATGGANQSGIITSSSGVTNLVTDNDELTSYSLGVKDGNNNAVWYEFPTETTISSYRLKTNGQGIPRIYTLDSNGVYVSTIITPANTEGILREITNRAGIKYIMISNRDASVDVEVLEFDVFGVPDTVAPISPNGLVGEPSDSQFNIMWDQNTETDLDGYNVYVDGVKINNTVISTTNYTLTNLYNGQEYNIYITAVDIYGNESLPSHIVTAIPIASIQAPMNLTATTNSGSVSLSWDAVPEADNYIVKRSTTSGGPYTTVAESVYETYEDTDVISGTTYYYVVAAVNAGGESPDSNEAAITFNNTLSLDVEKLVSTVSGLDEFTVDVKLNNAFDIYAEDLTVTYDTTLFELVSSDVGSTGLAFYHKDEATAGQLRYIIASQGRDYGINEDTAIVKLTFKAKNVAGTGTIGISSGLVADSVGNEYTPELNGTDITVELNSADVNNDGKFSLGDLSIAAYDYLQVAANVSDPDSDVDKDTNVNDIDLNLIVEAILSSV